MSSVKFSEKMSDLASKLVAFAICCGSLAGCEAARKEFDNEVQKEMNRVEKQVAEDAVKQYEIAKRSGSKMDAYVHAEMVAAAYLQAKDEGSYRKWKAISKADAAAAGMPSELTD
jgi:hypothetical protein